VKVCFVLNDIALSGGIGVVVEHAHQLVERHGFDVTVATTNDDVAPWTHRRLPDIACVTVEEAQQERYDVAVATLWSTCYRLFDIPAERYAYFVQSMEDRFFEPDAPAERVLAAITHALPVSFITEARWIADTLAEIRPDAPCFLVRNGIAKDVFSLPEPPPARPSRPLHILLEGHPDVWFKGLPEAAAVLRELREPHVTTFVSPSGKDGDPSVGADRVIGPLSQAELAAEYADTDVVLKLSRVEGMYGPPLEGFHMGATCVTTPVTGHDEFIQHGFNALVTDWDDPRGTACSLDLLARDRRLLHYLRTNAWLTAKGWPGWEQSSEFMAAALETIGASDPPSPYRAASHMLRESWLGISELRRDRERAVLATLGLSNDIRHLLELRAEVDTMSRDGVLGVARQIAPYSSSRPGRVAIRLGRALRRLRRPRGQS
jgi:glycosyltransferase involved in cell wall biosynthesis